MANAAGSSESHDSASETTLSVTGIGFQPKAIFLYWHNGNYYGYGVWCEDISYARGENSSSQVKHDTTVNVLLFINSTNYNNGTVGNLNADGFDITWAKTGSPSGTYDIEILCIG